jgi:hypothetical protein
MKPGRVLVLGLALLIGCGDNSAAPGGFPDGGAPDAGGCGAGQMLCGTICVSITDNPQHCGSCGNVCGGTMPLCVGTYCVSSCSGTLMPCSGTCVDFTKDAANCDGCNMPCGANKVCMNSTCVCNPALAGVKDCNGKCVDVMEDANNCGDCNVAVCHLEVCVGGQRQCAPGFMMCGAVGCLGCKNLQEDPENCGMCGKRCNTGEVCGGGNCVTTCPSATTLCNRSCVASPATDMLHCGCTGGGSPGTICGPGSFCSAGTCQDYTGSFGCNTCPCATCAAPGAGCCAYPAGRPVCTAATMCP